MNTMTVEELIEYLHLFNKDEKIVVFASGEIFPILGVSSLDNNTDTNDTVQIGCGWQPMGEKEVDNLLKK